MKLPRFAQIEPVGQCNLRCQMCPIQFRRDGPPWGPPALMPYDTFTKLIDELTDLRELHLQGLGEPLIHPRFFDMVTYAVRKKISVSTSTNGTLLHRRAAERCVESGLQAMHISVDGAQPETYEAIRPGANFDRVLRNIQGLIATRGRLKNLSPLIRVVMVVMRRNVQELPELVRLTHRLGVDELFVQHLCHDFGEHSLPVQYRPMVDFVEDQTLLAEDSALVAHVFQSAREAAASLGLRLRLPNLLPKPHEPGTPGPVRCDWPWRGPYISYHGETMPCCMLSTPDRFQLGNMAVDGSQAVWKGMAYEDFRRQLDSDHPPDVCACCSVYRGIF